MSDAAAAPSAAQQWLDTWQQTHPLQWRGAVARSDALVSGSPSIPRRIMQCGPLTHRDRPHVKTWLDLNQEYEHVFLTDEDAASFVDRVASEREAAAYGALNLGAQRADLLRLIYLRELGGVYADTDVELRWPLREFVPPTASLLTTSGWSYEFLAYEARHPLLVDAVHNITQQVLNQVRLRAAADKRACAHRIARRSAQ
jgi:mannosyltransferase OCH1-like enzyme